MNIEFAAEAMAMFGKSFPHHHFIEFGGGGNSKGLRSKLRRKCYGDSHEWCGSVVFNLNKDDEFRKQMHDLWRNRLRTTQEGAGFTVDETVWRAFT